MTFSNIFNGSWCTGIFPFNKNVSPVYAFATSLFTYHEEDCLHHLLAEWLTTPALMKSKKWKKQWISKASPFCWTATGITTQNNIPLLPSYQCWKCKWTAIKWGGEAQTTYFRCYERSVSHPKTSRCISHKPMSCQLQVKIPLVRQEFHMCAMCLVDCHGVNLRCIKNVCISLYMTLKTLFKLWCNLSYSLASPIRCHSN
jgi:hypothetical protein